MSTSPYLTQPKQHHQLASVVPVNLSAMRMNTITKLTWPEPWRQIWPRWRAGREEWPGCGTTPELRRPQKEWDPFHWGSDASQTSTRQEFIIYHLLAHVQHPWLIGMHWYVSQWLVSASIHPVYRANPKTFTVSRGRLVYLMFHIHKILAHYIPVISL